MKIGYGLVAYVLILCLGQRSADAQEFQGRAEDFVSSIGVNVHIMYGDTPYRNADKVIYALRYLGAVTLRDHIPSANGQDRYIGFANAGFRFDLIVGSNADGLDGTLASLDKFAVSSPNAIEAIEGPNEVNNWPISFQGKGGTEAALAYQSTLYDDLKSDRLLNRYPIYNFTDYPQPVGKADYLNEHSYPKGGAQPFEQLLKLFSAYSPAAYQGRAITEAGYVSLSRPADWKGPSSWYPVDETTRAILTLNYLLDSFYQGISRVYLYQLLDTGPDPNFKDVDRHLGLFDYNYNPKTVATAIHNLLLLLSNGSEKGGRPAAKASSYALFGLPEKTHSMLLKRADGAEIVIVWNERAIWDKQAKGLVALPSSHCMIRFSEPRSSVSIIDPIASAMPLKRFFKSDQIQFDLSNDPVVLVVSSN